MTTGPWIIRRAQASDLDALTWIAINAFRQDPQWNYRYPHATEFPDDHLEYTRRRYAVWLEANETPRCIIMVAEWRDPEDPVPKTVAMSIWRIPGRACSANGGVHSRMTPPTLAGERRDADQLHMQAYHGATKLVIDKYFNARYGQSQLSLAQLACHPSYSRRGAATKLLGWGLGLARELGKPVTLLAGPIAHRLYQRQGFLQVAMVTARVHGEKESVSFPGLVWDPKLREILQEQEWSEPCVPHENFVLGEEDSDGGIDTNA